MSETTVYANGRPVEIPYDEKFWLDVICFSHAARELLTQGYRSGARIHVLTWGSAAAGTYDSDSYEADLYLREHRDAIVCVAAGKLQAEGRGLGADPLPSYIVDGGYVRSSQGGTQRSELGALLAGTVRAVVDAQDVLDDHARQLAQE